MLYEMDCEDLRQWIEYYKTSPWGQERADLRAGIIASTFANANRAKRSRAYKPEDFMPTFGGTARRRPTQSIAEQKAIVERILAGNARAQAKHDERKRKQAAAAGESCQTV